MAAVCSAAHWGHALVSYVLMWCGWEREGESKEEKKLRRRIDALLLCHSAPTSAGVTHLPANIPPPCTDAAGKPCSFTERGQRMQRRICSWRLSNQAAGEMDVNVVSLCLKVQTESHRLLLGEGIKCRLLHILCLHSQWSGTTLPGPSKFTHTNPPICTSEHKELSPEKAIQSTLTAVLWKWQIRDVKQPGVGITTKEAFWWRIRTKRYYYIQRCFKLRLRLKFKY